MSSFAEHFALDPRVTFLNHGSFGACPRVVLEEQQHWRKTLERQPVLFLQRELEEHANAARVALGELLGTHADDLALVTNATTGVNTVLRSLDFKAGDELLTTDHEYNASRNALEFVAGRHGATLKIASIPFPLAGEDEALEAILQGVTARTRLVLVDHVTSATGMILPVDRLGRELAQRNIDLLVDGAHAPGMLPLELEAMGVAYYTGNCHKWLCTPKGSAVLYVRRDLQQRIRPLVISHGANAERENRSLFRNEFDWQGTHDPSPWLCIPTALKFLRGLLPGGLPALRQRNHDLVSEGRRALCQLLGIEEPCPKSMLGSLATVPLPDADASERKALFDIDPLQSTLYREHRIEVPVMTWPRAPKRVLRISAQAYNEAQQYQQLASALGQCLKDEARRANAQGADVQRASGES